MTMSSGSVANAASATLDITATVDAGTAGSTITNTPQFEPVAKDSKPIDRNTAVGKICAVIHGLIRSIT